MSASPSNLVRSLFIAILICAPVLVCADDRKKVEDDLRQSLVGTYLSLRVPDGSSQLHFTSKGQLKGSPSPLPWTTGGLFRVEKVSLKAKSIEIEGNRALVAWRLNANPALMTVVTQRRVKLDVDLDSPPAQASEAIKLLVPIFESGGVDQRVAATWTPDPSADVPNGPRVLGVLAGGRDVYRIHRGDVEPPQPLYTPNPNYTDSARKDRLQGNTSLKVIVNEHGQPEIIEIAKGLGDGMDLQALDAVSQWRFQPATMNKKAVPVEITIQIGVSLQ
jgi:TonB family protein